MKLHVPRRQIMAVLCLALVGSACGPVIGPPVTSTPPAGPRIAITSASVNGSNQVVVSYTLTQDGKGLSGTSASGMQPTWTLAGLSTDPVTVNLPADPVIGQPRSPVPAWQSYLLTGSETLTSLPIDGPGTPAAFVLSNVKQPGSESGGTTEDLGGGKFIYTFQHALPQGFNPAQTLRVGVWLAGAPGTRQTTSTFDFVPNGGAAQARELVLDTNCNKCHGTLQGHGGSRTGVKICLTCHTYQNADADTVDPAALTSATQFTNPNPLDMGRLIHRIHRGKNLPTLYQSSSTATAPTLPATSLPLPFNPSRTSPTGLNPPLVGHKYSIIGDQSSEFVFGEVVNRTDNNQPAKVVATGVAYPQDLRNCDACHGGAPQASEHLTDISRRTCQGCHPDVWFQDTNLQPITDYVHFAHAGGPQCDDSQCMGCHIPTSSSPSYSAPIADVHVAPILSPNYNELTAKIVYVLNLSPGQTPTVIYTLEDREGLLTSLNSPSPATDPSSPVARAVPYLALTISGPTSPDYLTGNTPINERLDCASHPGDCQANASGQFSYTFRNSTVPPNAVGTWAVGIEAFRASPSPTLSNPVSTPFYDTASDKFFWPYTGEMLRETTDNPIEYVDVSVGMSPGGILIPRRQVVSRDKCNNCHLKLGLHGTVRHKVEYCVMCHTPDASDWKARPKDATTGNTDLDATYDDIEERSIHFKVLIHRIHTGSRTGSAELDLARPLTVYHAQSPMFLDEVRFPNDLANCTLCHQGTSYAPESVPKDAQPTVANETATIQHQGSATHGANETKTPPVQAACMGCHDTGAAQFHAQEHTTSSGEQCASCHGVNGSTSVNTVHGLQ